MRSCQSIDNARHHLVAVAQGCAIGDGGVQCGVQNCAWCATVHVADQSLHNCVYTCRSSIFHKSSQHMHEEGASACLYASQAYMTCMARFGRGRLAEYNATIPWIKQAARTGDGSSPIGREPRAKGALLTLTASMVVLLRGVVSGRGKSISKVWFGWTAVGAPLCMWLVSLGTNIS